MTLALRLLCRVVQRRVKNGESMTVVLEEYPRLTTEEKAAVQAVCGK